MFFELLLRPLRGGELKSVDGSRGQCLQQELRDQFSSPDSKSLSIAVPSTVHTDSLSRCKIASSVPSITGKGDPMESAEAGPSTGPEIVTKALLVGVSTAAKKWQA